MIKWKKFGHPKDLCRASGRAAGLPGEEEAQRRIVQGATTWELCEGGDMGDAQDQ